VWGFFVVVVVFIACITTSRTVKSYVRVSVNLVVRDFSFFSVDRNATILGLLKTSGGKKEALFTSPFTRLNFSDCTFYSDP
jgi:hypothetical protein